MGTRARAKRTDRPKASDVMAMLRRAETEAGPSLSAVYQSFAPLFEAGQEPTLRQLSGHMLGAGNKLLAEILQLGLVRLGLDSNDHGSSLGSVLS